MQSKDLIPKELVHLSNAEQLLVEKLVEKRVKAETKFPLAATLLASFGLVSTFYGFEKVIDSIDVFAKNPWILLITGITILIITGSIYRKL